MACGLEFRAVTALHQGERDRNIKQQGERMRIPRVFAIWILLAVSLSACATLPKRNLETQEQLVEANAALDTLNQDMQQFFLEVEEVRQDVRLLYQHPGWTEMLRIFDVMAAAADEGATVEVDVTDVARMTEDWTSKWQEPWEALFSKYLSLLQRCSALEAKRLALQSRLLGVQAKFLRAAAMEYAGGRLAPGQSINEIVGILNRSAEDLNTYTVNALGLYD